LRHQVSIGLLPRPNKTINPHEAATYAAAQQTSNQSLVVSSSAFHLSIQKTHEELRVLIPFCRLPWVIGSVQSARERLERGQEKVEGEANVVFGMSFLIFLS
jgi:hypothetical protein